MSDSFETGEYINVAGLVAWDSEERELPKSGDTIRTFTVEILPTGLKLKATLWPELFHVNPKQGDFVAIRGKYALSEYEGNNYHNVSVSSIVLQGAEVKMEQGEEASVI